MRTKGTTVRLTESVHTLLLKKAEDYSARGHKISMKDIAKRQNEERNRQERKKYEWKL